MKLLIASSAAPDRGSGIGNYAKDLTEAFIEMGIEVHFMSPTPDDYSWLNRFGIKHLATDQDDDQIEKAGYVLSYIKKNKIDGAINNDNSLLQSIAPGLTCPLIVIGHSNLNMIAALANYRHEWSDYIVTISYSMQKRFIKRFKTPLYKCPIVYNGVKDRLKESNTITISGSYHPRLKCIYAGGFGSIKGGDLLLKTVMKDKARWDGITLEWYGDVPDQIKSKLSKINFVKYFGRVTRADFLKALSRADILLLPSRLEGCPMVLLEAMSYGVVPIASDGEGAMSWMIRSGQDGFICHLDSWPEQSLGCMEFLKVSPERLMEFKRKTRSRFLDEFQISLVAKVLLGYLERPTVDRGIPQRSFDVLKWHRPLRPDGKKAPLLDRFLYKAGLLWPAGVYENR